MVKRAKHPAGGGRDKAASSRRPAAGTRYRPGRDAPTSYDVARLADVSQSAVSRCFRIGASLSEAKRKRILAAARKLGYAPDALARGLTTRQSNVIGVIISNLTNLYYPEVLSELNARCAERAMHLMLFTIQSESDVDQVLAHVWQYRLDGVIVASSLSDAQMQAFDRRGVPFVFYNRYARERDVNAVCCDQYAGARLMVDALVAAGHGHFGIVGGPPDSVVGGERVDGCVTRLRHHGIKQYAVVPGDYTYAGGRAALLRLVEKVGRRLDAVVAAADAMALGCIDALRHQLQRSVPGDVSVVSFDGVEPGSWDSYQLTTIRQPVKDMAAATVNLLLECIANPQRAPEKRVLAGTLVRGGSARLLIAAHAGVVEAPPDPR